MARRASVLAWLDRHDSDLALSTVALGEIAFGIEQIRPDQRAKRLEEDLALWRNRFLGRIYPFGEEAAMEYGLIMGQAVRRGRPMSAEDGMIAAITRIHGGQLATRNVKDFRHCGIELVNPWETSA